jgi:hypothetical protein
LRVIRLLEWNRKTQTWEPVTLLGLRVGFDNMKDAEAARGSTAQIVGMR